MLAKPEWFGPRKYGGWGYMPRSKEGWMFVIGCIALLVIINEAPIIPDPYRMWALIGFGFLFAVESVHIMTSLKRDEREERHEAISERNAAWSMVGVILIGILYQVSTASAEGVGAVDPFLLGALGVGAFAKTLTWYYLRNK